MLGLALAVSLTSDARAQLGGGQGGSSGNGQTGSPGGYGGQGGLGGQGGMGGRRGQGGNQNTTPMPDKSSSPRTSDPEAYDAIDLFSRLCVSTQGSRARALGIVDDGDTAIEKMEPPLLRGLEGGQSGGIGWIIRMPLGDKILLEFPPDGSCIVRAPRVNAGQLEAAFRNLLDQYSASGQFDIRREGEQTKTIDIPKRKSADADADGDPDPAENPNDNLRRISEKPKMHMMVYTMKLPDAGQSVQLVVATTASQAISIQGVLSYAPLPAEPTRAARGRP
jgi:hypothetical protein